MSTRQKLGIVLVIAALSFGYTVHQRGFYFSGTIQKVPYAFHILLFPNLLSE